MRSHCFVLAFVASLLIFFVAWLVCASMPTSPQTQFPANDSVSSELYTALLDLRNTELAALWSRFNIHLAVNVGLLVALLAASDEKIGKFGMWPYTLGLVAVMVWLASDVAGRHALHTRDAALGRFEDAYFSAPLRDYAQFIPLANLPWWNPFVQQLRGQMLVSWFLILAFGFVWAALFLKEVSRP